MSQPLDPTTTSSLEAFRIPHLPPDFYYIPNFITAEEEASILQKIPANRWVTLSHRRLQAHPSTLTKSNTLLGAPLPPYLTTPIIPRFNALGIFTHTPHSAPNHVLINEYNAGEGIMPHEDGDAYAHVVATVSLGGSICLDVCWKEDVEHDGVFALPLRILQEPRSLLVTGGTAYSSLMHGIAAVQVDEGLTRDTVANWRLLGDGGAGVERNAGRCERGCRVSLTYRDVVKVSKAAGKVFGVGRR